MTTPTGAGARAAGPSLTQQGRIYTGDELEQDVTVQCDVCIVGSGAGGAWLALELVKRGKSVVMLEEGGYHTRAEFDMTEARAFPALYQELGARSTDDMSISILQGRSVGGGTTVNWCSSFRTPQRILDVWRERHGVDTLSTQVLAPHWDAIEQRLHIKEWPLELMNENNRVLWDGLGALGYSRGLIRRNVNNCANLGACGLGCPIDAKQSMLVTTIPDAVERGLTVYANASARTFSWEGRKVTAVNADVLDPATNKPKGVRLTVKPKLAVSSGGAINSPGLLLRSGLDCEERVGLRTWFHPVIPQMALFDRRIDGYAGAPQSAYSHHFADRGPGKLGFFFEVPPLYPMLSATAVSGFGAELQEDFKRLPFMHGMIALTIDGLLPDEEGATVQLRDGGYGRYNINYAFRPQTWEALRAASLEMAKIQFAAGAVKVVSLHLNPVVLDSPADSPKLERAPWERVKVKLLTAHQMGGCAMGKVPETSIVDPHLKFHTMDNLYVVDGSVLPTSLGVNPQLTIFGIARWAAEHIAAAV